VPFAGGGDRADLRLRLRAVQEGEDGEDATVAAVGGREAELEEHVADVLADGSLGDGEGLGDGRVVAPFVPRLAAEVAEPAPLAGGSACL
jgi:hypothetical protein